MIDDDIFIAPINPIGFSDVRPESYYDFKHNPFDCYAQKFENNDTTTIQILSKKSVEEVNLIRCFDNKKVKSYNFQNIGSVNMTNSPFLLGPGSYRVYQADIEFSSLNKDFYFIEIKADSLDPLFSNLIHVAEKWENTLLIEYLNSEDHEGFKFDFQNEEYVSIRVEGTIREFQPGSDDNIYIDQPHQSFTLSSSAFRNFTLFVGGGLGIPDYLSDTINRIMTVDHLKIDGDRFNKTDESEWEVQRDPDIPFQSMSMTIQAVDPILPFNFSSILTPQLLDEGDWVIFRRSINRTSGADFNVNNIFEDKTTLEYITIYKKNAQPYILKVGTTAGDNDILETLIDDEIETLHLRQNFDAPTTLYLSGISEMQDFHIVYEKLNKRGGELGSGNNSNQSSLPINSIIVYGGDAQQLSADFNLATGLARPGSQFRGFAICDGRNGTYDFTDSFAYGWNFNDGQIKDIVGQNLIKLKESELPKITPRWKWSEGMRNDTFQGRDGTVYVDMNTANKPSNNSPIDRNPIESFGGGEDLDIRSRRTLSIYIQKIS